ncbi:hypothetical protein HPB52_023221 [Rhipicephalus sanguineus]|uniref:DDE Tnp4 domain-containing protein n=1 Tax=Rhipicephalus sanguineus TaxID=34632 RepID=A0A9D4QFU9_RHISA|nr:hypothetical protein HPB52_023221 [Rhipicephalus sanguineus]
MNSHKRQFLALAAVLLANVEDDDIFLQAAKRHKKENAGKKEPAAASKQLLVTRLNAGPHDYMDLLCVSREQFLHLMSRVRMGIVKDKTVANRHVSAQTRLQVTLRYLTSGELPESLRDQFKLGRADVGALIQKTCNKAIYSNKAQLPEAIKVESSPDVLLPPVFIADDTLPLERHVMKPFIGSNLTQEKRGFNERLAMVQQVANDAFGAMESRFGCLRTVIQEKPERVAAIVNATCVLHNFLGNHVPSPPGASAKASSGTEVFFGFPSSCGNTSVDGCATRDVLTAFFKS